MARSRHSSFRTGSIPGTPISTKFAWVLGSAPKVFREVENILCFVFIYTWNSKSTLHYQDSISLESSFLRSSLALRVSLTEAKLKEGMLKIGFLVVIAGTARLANKF